MALDWEGRRQAAQAIAAEVEQNEDANMNCVLAAGFLHGALASARRIDGEPVGMTVEPVMVDDLATNVIRVTVPGVLKSEYFLTITQGKELE